MELKGKKTSCKIEYGHVQHARITLSRLANKVSWVMEASKERKSVLEGDAVREDTARTWSLKRLPSLITARKWKRKVSAAEWTAVLSCRRCSERSAKHGSSQWCSCSKRRHLTRKAGHNLSVSLLQTRQSRSSLYRCDDRVQRDWQGEGKRKCLQMGESDDGHLPPWSTAANDEDEDDDAMLLLTNAAHDSVQLVTTSACATVLTASFKSTLYLV